MARQKHPTMAQIERVFTHHQPADKNAAAALEKMRKKFGALAVVVHKSLPDNREKAIVLTKLEEASMFAIAGMARPAPVDPDAAPVAKAKKSTAKKASPAKAVAKKAPAAKKGPVMPEGNETAVVKRRRQRAAEAMD